MCVSALGLQSLINPEALDIMVVGKDGKKRPFEPQDILETISMICSTMSDSKAELLYSRVEYSIFGGMTNDQLKRVVIKCAKYLAEFDSEFEQAFRKLNFKLDLSDINTYPLPSPVGFGFIKKTL